MALPAMTVDTIQDAKDLQILCCAKAYDGERFMITASSGFQKGNVDSMIAAGEWLETMYQKIKRRN